ncbi:MAG: hypothetical protein DHS80DRAFT_30775 [Piptocephalis tieghemiana]|nr:MAG: hypothetical protein DHS80DRAFT_30775 [Piptocephalis tieghemiana]
MNALYGLIAAPDPSTIPRPLRNLEAMVLRPALPRDAQALETIRSDHIMSNVPLSLGRLFFSSPIPGIATSILSAIGYQLLTRISSNAAGHSLWLRFPLILTAALAIVLHIGFQRTSSYFEREVKEESKRFPLQDILDDLELEQSKKSIVASQSNSSAFGEGGEAEEEMNGKIIVALISNRYVGFSYLLPSSSSTTRQVRIFLHANHRHDIILPRLLGSILRGHPSMECVIIHESGFQTDLLRRYNVMGFTEKAREPAGPWGNRVVYEARLGEIDTT